MKKDNLFTSIDDLYKRLLPALNTKTDELKRLNILIDGNSIWLYCVKNIWNKEKDLRIHEMVSDILNIDETKLIEFSKKWN